MATRRAKCIARWATLAGDSGGDASAFLGAGKLEVMLSVAKLHVSNGDSPPRLCFDIARDAMLGLRGFSADDDSDDDDDDDDASSAALSGSFDERGGAPGDKNRGHGAGASGTGGGGDGGASGGGEAGMQGSLLRGDGVPMGDDPMDGEYFAGGRLADADILGWGEGSREARLAAAGYDAFAQLASMSRQFFAPRSEAPAGDGAAAGTPSHASPPPLASGGNGGSGGMLLSPVLTGGSREAAASPSPTASIGEGQERFVASLLEWALNDVLERMPQDLDIDQLLRDLLEDVDAPELVPPEEELRELLPIVARDLRQSIAAMGVQVVLTDKSNALSRGSSMLSKRPRPLAPGEAAAASPATWLTPGRIRITWGEHIHPCLRAIETAAGAGDAALSACAKRYTPFLTFLRDVLLEEAAQSKGSDGRIAQQLRSSDLAVVQLSLRRPLLWQLFGSPRETVKRGRPRGRGGSKAGSKRGRSAAFSGGSGDDPADGQARGFRDRVCHLMKICQLLQASSRAPEGPHRSEDSSCSVALKQAMDIVEALCCAPYTYSTNDITPIEIVTAVAVDCDGWRSLYDFLLLIKHEPTMLQVVAKYLVTYLSQDWARAVPESLEVIKSQQESQQDNRFLWLYLPSAPFSPGELHASLRCKLLVLVAVIVEAYEKALHSRASVEASRGMQPRSVWHKYLLCEERGCSPEQSILEFATSVDELMAAHSDCRPAATLLSEVLARMLAAVPPE